ncbi:LOW QUALITY PROTEIN: hypothetical protein YC2023_084522 [Brassica napus]
MAIEYMDRGPGPKKTDAGRLLFFLEPPPPSWFASELISTMVSLCFSCQHEALPVFRLVMRCRKYIPWKNLEIPYFFCVSPHSHHTEQEVVIESLGHLLPVWKDLALPYSRDLSLVVLSLVFMLAKSSVENEQHGLEEAAALVFRGSGGENVGDHGGEGDGLFRNSGSGGARESAALGFRGIGGARVRRSCGDNGENEVR